MQTFKAIDVETANADRSSICSVGVVSVRDSEIIKRWSTLVNPETWFDPFNSCIHGIFARDVAEAPKLPAVLRSLRGVLLDSVLVHHTAFDRTAFSRALEAHEMEPYPVTWLDSAAVARRAWPLRYARSGWGLANVAHDLGIRFDHHVAVEDAKAAARIVLKACQATEKDVAEWCDLVKGPIMYPEGHEPPKRKLKPKRKPRGVVLRAERQGVLADHTIVFTGRPALSGRSISKAEAASLAAQAGADVDANCTTRTTLLVVGSYKKGALGQSAKSSKHRRAEELISEGYPITILTLEDFNALLR